MKKETEQAWDAKDLTKSAFMLLTYPNVLFPRPGTLCTPSSALFDNVQMFFMSTSGCWQCIWVVLVLLD